MSANSNWNNTKQAESNSTPVYDGGVLHNEIVNCNNNTLLYLVNKTSEQEYEDYCQKLVEEQFEPYVKRSVKDNRFRTFFKGDTLVQANYYGYANEARVVVEEDAIRIGKENENTYARKYQTLLTQLELDQTNVDCGMSYVIRSADGSFFIIDGGYNTPGESERLYEHMRNLAPENEDIVVSGWYFSHGHSDHIGCFIDFIKAYHEQVKVERFFYNIPNYVASEKYNRNEEELQYLIMFFETMDEYCLDAEHIKIHTGQIFYVRNLKFEVLYTHEDLYPVPIHVFNDSSSVLMMEAEGRKVLWLGDALDEASDRLVAKYGDYLKCDIVQMAHHGFNGAKKEVYELADPSIVLWPTADYRFDENTKRPSNNFLLNDSNVKEHYISGHGTVTLELS